MNAFGESAEVADALHFVVGKLDAEMIFQAREKLKRLKAVDAELLEEVIGWREGAHGDIEMPGGEIHDFLRGLVKRSHWLNLSFWRGK